MPLLAYTTPSAASSGVHCFLFAASRAAPLSARNWITGTAPPRYTAPCSAVSPSLLTALTSPPPTSNASLTAASASSCVPGTLAGP